MTREGDRDVAGRGRRWGDGGLSVPGGEVGSSGRVLLHWAGGHHHQAHPIPRAPQLLGNAAGTLNNPELPPEASVIDRPASPYLRLDFVFITAPDSL